MPLFCYNDVNILIKVVFKMANKKIKDGFVSNEEKKSLEDLQKQIKELQEENEILRKAMDFSEKRK